MRKSVGRATRYEHGCGVGHATQKEINRLESLLWPTSRENSYLSYPNAINIESKLL